MIRDFKFYNQSQPKMQSNTVLFEYKNQKVTVSQMLTAVKNSFKFIKDHFNVDKEPYSVAIMVLNLLQIHLLNQNVRRPTKEQLKCLVDVFHEIEDLNAKTDNEKQQNEKIANELNMIIDFFYKGDQND